MSALHRAARLGYAAARILIPGGRWRYEGRGDCPSCNRRSIFVLAEGHAAWVRELAAPWDQSAAFKSGLVIRESEICAFCGANYRMRAQATTMLGQIGLARSSDLVRKLRAEPQFTVYETAHRNVFRLDELVQQRNYVTSEYFENAKPGEIVGGVMNQNLESLSFEDGSFDVVMTSEVLEHVAHLDRALAETARVLKPGGCHVFTVPSDPELAQTIERARLVDGRITHVMPPVTHGDSMRAEGILAFRDFGADTAKVIEGFGFDCREEVYTGTNGFITSVFVAVKRR